MAQCREEREGSPVARRALEQGPGSRQWCGSDRGGWLPVEVGDHAPGGVPVGMVPRGLVALGRPDVIVLFLFIQKLFKRL
jgi:hypothetical protein